MIGNGKNGPEDPPAEGPLPPMEIPVSSTRKLVGNVLYVLLYLAVAVALVVLCWRFTGSLALAVVLVLFMGGYMLLMTRWASQDIETHDRR